MSAGGGADGPRISLPSLPASGELLQGGSGSSAGSPTPRMGANGEGAGLAGVRPSPTPWGESCSPADPSWTPHSLQGCPPPTAAKPQFPFLWKLGLGLPTRKPSSGLWPCGSNAWCLEMRQRWEGTQARPRPVPARASLLPGQAQEWMLAGVPLPPWGRWHEDPPPPSHRGPCVLGGSALPLNPAAAAGRVMP